MCVCVCVCDLYMYVCVVLFLRYVGVLATIKNIIEDFFVFSSLWKWKGGVGGRFTAKRLLVHCWVSSFVNLCVCVCFGTARDQLILLDHACTTTFTYTPPPPPLLLLLLLFSFFSSSYLSAFGCVMILRSSIWGRLTLSSDD